MKRATRIFVLTFTAFFFCAAAPAQAGTFLQYNAAWNGISRMYSVYIPPNLPPNPAMVMVLHGTVNAPLSSIATAINFCTNGMAWNGGLADANGFLLVCPVSTWKQGPANDATGGYFFWDSEGMDNYFPTPPDDAGFLRSLILQMEQPVSASTSSVPTFGVNPKRVFVTGMSSGGMMTFTMAETSSDLIAAIAPVSASIWVSNAAMKLAAPAQPVSMIEFHGDADTTIAYCGGLFSGWGEVKLQTASVDQDVNFWLSADGFPPNPNNLCANGGSTSITSLDFRNPNGVEIQFIRELGFGHVYRAWVSGAAWEFFSTHERQ
jgi:polyhydroxybutyrate depolymerase